MIQETAKDSRLSSALGDECENNKSPVTSSDSGKPSEDVEANWFINDQDDNGTLPPIAGSLPEEPSVLSSSSSMSTSDALFKHKKSVKFPDVVDKDNSCPLVSFISPSTPTPPSHRRLHNDAVYSKFIEFLERGRPMRRFIREGLFSWRRRLFSSKKELVVHLFSDIICFSRKNADGYLYLLEKCKLKQCRAELDQMTITITCGNSVIAITGPSEYVTKGWFNDIQALVLWCQKGEAGIMPVMPSPVLEIAFASAHSRSISVALRQEIITKAGINSKSSPSHFRSTSAVPSANEEPQKQHTQKFEMSWEYAVDQMNLMRSVMKTANNSDIMDKERQIRADRQKVAMAARLEALQAGDFLLKYDRSGNCYQRFYRIDPQGEILSWSRTKPSITTSEKRLEMASLSNVVIGPQTKRFQRYLKEGRKTPWLCFSLIPFSHSAHTIDLECRSAEQFDCWVLGLQSLIPLWHSTHITQGHLLWIRTMMKLDFVGMTNKLKDRAEALRYIEANPLPIDDNTSKPE